MLALLSRVIAPMVHPPGRIRRRVGLLALSLAGPAFAPGQVIFDTYPFWDGNITSGYVATAETFIVPTGNGVLDSFKFALAARAGGGSVSFEVYHWDTAGPVGPAVYTQVVSWPDVGGDIILTNLNVVLTPGQNYGAVMNLLGYSGQSVHWMNSTANYAQGNGWWNTDGSAWQSLTGLNLKFTAQFVPVPEPPVLGLLAAGLPALVTLTRRRRSLAGSGQFVPTCRPKSAMWGEG